MTLSSSGGRCGDAVSGEEHDGGNDAEVRETRTKIMRSCVDLVSGQACDCGGPVVVADDDAAKSLPLNVSIVCC